MLNGMPMTTANRGEIPMLVKRDDLFVTAREELSAAIHERDEEAYGRARSEIPTPELVVCLGDFRCMFPMNPQARRGRYCAFCTRVSPNATPADVEAIVQKHVKGN